MDFQAAKRGLPTLMESSIRMDCFRAAKRGLLTLMDLLSVWTFGPPNVAFRCRGLPAPHFLKKPIS